MQHFQKRVCNSLLYGICLRVNDGLHLMKARMKYQFINEKKPVFVITLKLQLMTLYWVLTLLYQVSLPIKSTDRIMKIHTSYHSSSLCYLNYLCKPTANEKGSVLAGQNKVSF